MSRRCRLILALALAMTLGAGAGCRALRAEVGFGICGGASVKIPYVLHTGMEGGLILRTWGHRYIDGMIGRSRQDDVGMALVYHCVRTGTKTDKKAGPWGHPGRGKVLLDAFGDPVTPVGNRSRRKMKRTHWCLGLLPGLTHGDDPESYALEVSVSLLFLRITLGFNPWYLGDTS